MKIGEYVAATVARSRVKYAAVAGGVGLHVDTTARVSGRRAVYVVARGCRGGAAVGRVQEPTCRSEVVQRRQR